ncbi:MAG TPA: hypothetical protein VNW99_11470 [Cytophagaceae bacterium]|jgi:hypothetical protein|nr:hypothetical protein [Cytophagaceae bacterium]
MIRSFLILSIASTLFFSCSNKNNEKTSQQIDTTEVIVPMPTAAPVEDTTGMMVKGNIKLIPFRGSAEFNDATLELNKPEENAKLKSGDVQFSYVLKNYTLAVPTPDAASKHCNNSPKGQHIHLILNNEPYIAHYETDFTEKLKDGHYVALSFLSRSYHESLKQFEAFDLRQFTVGNIPSKKIDLTKPFLFYSRPKGEYTGEDTKRILLDFYLVNTTLDPKGNKVKATINGNEFMIDQWQPFVIEGLPMGENTVQLELLDKNGKFVEGPFNKVERKFTLK